MNSAIVTAAGQGTRFGAKKAIQLLKGRPLLAWAVSNFEKIETFGEIIVTIPPDDAEDFYADLISSENFQKVRFVKGGETRYESVRKGFFTVRNEDGIVLIHDAARPLVSRELIEKVLDGAEQYGAAIPVVPVNETVKEAKDGKVVRTIPRESLFLAQTPQGFRFNVLREAYSKIKDVIVTDEAMLVELAGHGVYIVEGDPRNIKITNRFDLLQAESSL